MKVIHGICLLAISVFFIRITAQGHILTDKHYYKMLFLSLGVTLLYIFPFIYIGYVSFKDNSTKFQVWDENN